MKKSKILLSVAIVFVCSMFMSLNVRAISCNDVKSLNDLKESVKDDTCEEIRITTGFDITDNVTINNKRIVLGSGVRLAVDKGANLTITGYDNSKDKGTTNIWLESGARIVVRGTVNVSTVSDEKLIAFQGNGSTTNPTGEITVLEGGELSVNGYVNGAIAVLKNLNVKSDGKVTLTGNGYGTNGYTNITLDNGHIIANNKNVGLNGVIKAYGSSTIEANNNGILGVNFKDGSEINGTTIVTATDNGTNTELKNASKRLSDITISGRLGINDNAQVTTGVIREFFEVGGDPENPIGFETGKETKLVVGGKGVVVKYTDIIPSGEDNEKLNLYHKVGVLKDALGNVKAVNIDEYIVQPNEKLVLDNKDTMPKTIYALNRSSIENRTGEDITVTVQGLDSNKQVTVKNGETKDIKVITVNVNGKNYFILSGESLSDISALSEFLSDENISRLETSSGTIIDENTALENDTTIVVRNKVKVKYNGVVYTLEYEETWNGTSTGAKELQKALSKVHEESTRDFVEFLGNGMPINNKFKFTEYTEITVRYSVKVTFDGVTESYDEGTYIKDMPLLKDVLSNSRFVYFKGSDGKTYGKDDVVENHVTLIAVYKVVVSFNDDEFTSELAMGDELDIGSFKNASSKTLKEAMNEFAIKDGKNSAYFIDENGNRVYYTTKTDKDMTITYKYTIRVEINGKVVTPDEGTYVKDIELLNDVASSEDFYYFEDENGNHYTLDDVLNNNVKLNAVYKVIIKVNPVEGVSIGVGYVAKKGTTLRDILKQSWGSGLQAYLDSERFLNFKDENGNVIGLDDEINEDVVLTAVYSEIVNSDNSDVEVPNTLDNITSYLILSIISLMAIIVLSITRKNLSE